jgi:hypothetical protein
VNLHKASAYMEKARAKEDVRFIHHQGGR